MKLKPRIIDLSHTLVNGLITFPGAPPIKINEFLGREASRSKYEPGVAFHIGRMDMIGSSGTYMDVPFHRFAEGNDLAGQDLSRTVDLEGALVRVPMDAERSIGPELIENLDLRGKAVLFHTGWSKYFGRPEYTWDYPFISRAAAEALREAAPALVGVDAMNVDDVADGFRPTHTILLGAGILIVEHLTGLDRLPETGFRFFAAPLKIKDMGTTPVRAFALVEPAGAPA